jgi:acetyl esterase/lipase
MIKILNDSFSILNPNEIPQEELITSGDTNIDRRAIHNTNNDDLKEYIVVLKNFEDLDEFYNDMETPGGNLYIPDREVSIMERRPSSRSTHYMLTSAEAISLLEDPRVETVSLTFYDIGGEVKSFSQYSNKWNKSGNVSATSKNWGVYRVFTGNTVSNWGYDGTGNTSGNVNITNSGKNVDVIICDGHIPPNHPEFTINPEGAGGYPNAIDDIKTILKFCLESGAGASQSASWATIYNYISTYGLLVTGSSAGGHLAMMGVGNYGTETGRWPAAVGSTCGPMDLVYSPYGSNDNPLDAPIQNLVNSFSTPDGKGGNYGYDDTRAKASSPRYKYGTTANPGEWYTALNASSCKFLFIQNNNDTLVKNSMVTPFVNSLPGAKTSIKYVTEIDPTYQAVLPYDHNFSTSLSDHIKDFAANAFTVTAVVSTTVTTTYDIPYGTNRLQRVDLLVPATTPRGVVMHIHGGAWSGGSKSSSGFTSTDAAYTVNDEAEIQKVVQAGYVVISCNYRVTSLASYGYGGNPEGGSRVVQYNWLQHNPAVTGDSAGTYVYDFLNTATAISNNNHGTHVAGIACGNSQGWARNCNIYNIYPYSLGSIQADNNINWTYYVLDYIRQFHINKPINPATNRKNPTIVNCSWGLTASANLLLTGNVTYQNLKYSPRAWAAYRATLGLVASDTVDNNIMLFMARDSSIDSDVASCISSGIIIIGAAGNYLGYNDILGGLNYNNALHDITTDIPKYYMRGSSPTAANNVINVSWINNTISEEKDQLSNSGPRTDLFAPGGGIVSSYLTSGVADPRNSSYYINTSSGTSMATPQVTGVLACALETYQSLTPVTALNYLITNSTKNQLANVITNTNYPFLNYTSLLWGPNRYLKYTQERNDIGALLPKNNYGTRTTGLTYPRRKIKRAG